MADLLRTMRWAASAAGPCPELADGTAASVLEGAAAIAERVLLPLDRTGDRHGVTLTAGAVRTAPGWPSAYREWIAGGWNGLAAPEESGGMGLPLLLHFAAAEIWSGACLAFGLAPILTSGAVEALTHHATPELKARFLPKLVAGTWTGTMNLTEPQAGSDLGGLAARAVPRADGSYAITGQKIYISFGDHDLAENIVHLVLARLPDAPAGTRGISLFVVPKILVEADGALAGPNDVRCAGLERKLGLHGAPTCTMSFGEAGGATGYLVGEENRGLACMFTMMNNARLAVGIEGVAAAERATQTAIAFARERRQGRAGDEASAPIVRHPDVARMLMTMQTSTAAARAICLLTAATLDAARRGADPAIRQAAAHRAALLTPIAKAFSTDIANEVASFGIQVHGGMGYVEETGAAQILRDARVFAIYEGTNGIQAIDLVTRKLSLDGGLTLERELAGLRRTVEQMRGHNDIALRGKAAELDAAVEALARTSAALKDRLAGNAASALAVASPYLRLFGLTLGAAALADIALRAQADTALRAQTDDHRPSRATSEARFFAENVLPAARGLERIVLKGGDALVDGGLSWFEALRS